MQLYIYVFESNPPFKQNVPQCYYRSRMRLANHRPSTVCSWCLCMQNFALVALAKFNFCDKQRLFRILELNDQCIRITTPLVIHWKHLSLTSNKLMMTSWYRNIFRITGPLSAATMISLLLACISCLTNNRVSGNWIRHDAYVTLW